MRKTEMRVVASFDDNPEKVIVILPLGDPQVMLGEVTTKPKFQLFGTAISYSYPDEELGKRPAQPANTLIEMGIPYCFHVPDNAMFELKQDGTVSHLVFRKVWTTRAAGSSKADYRSPMHVLYHNKTTVGTPNFPTEPDLGPEPICTGLNVRDNPTRILTLGVRDMAGCKSNEVEKAKLIQLLECKAAEVLKGRQKSQAGKPGSESPAASTQL